MKQQEVETQRIVNAERFAFVPGRNWLVTCDADGTIPLNSRIVAEFVKEPPAELIAAMEALPELLAAAKNAIPFMQESWRIHGVGGQFEVMDALRSAIARAEGGAA